MIWFQFNVTVHNPNRITIKQQTAEKKWNISKHSIPFPHPHVNPGQKPRVVVHRRRRKWDVENGILFWNHFHFSSILNGNCREQNVRIAIRVEWRDAEKHPFHNSSHWSTEKYTWHFDIWRNDKRHTLIRQKFNSPFSQTNNQHSSSSDHNIQTHNFHSHYYEDLQHQFSWGLALFFSLSSTRSRSVDSKTGFQNQTLTTSEHINTRQERTREQKPLHCSWHRVDSASLLMQQYSLDHWHFDLFYNIIDFRIDFGKNPKKTEWKRESECLVLQFSSSRRRNDDKQ